MKSPLYFVRKVCLVFSFFILHFFTQAQTVVTGGSGFPVGTPMGGVAYGSGVYVAVGSSGFIMKSTDGITWTTEKNSSFLNVAYTRVIFGNGLFVAVSSTGTIVTSPDGTNWTQRTSGTSNYLYDLIYANSTYVIVGSNNTTLTSTDAITWTSVNIGAGATDVLLSVVYAQSKFHVGVRGSADSKVYSSTTAAAGTWSSSTITGAGPNLNKVVYLNNTFFAFNANTNIYTSTNGTSWTQLINGRLTGTNQVFNAFYDGTTYFLFGSCTEHSYLGVFTSTDGVNFSLQPQKTYIVTQNSAFVNGRYFVMGNEGLVSSSDGINWSYPGGSHNAVVYSGSMYVAVGQTAGSEGSIYTSTNWTTWTKSYSSIFKPLNGVTFGNGRFIAVGNADGSGFGTIANSTNGTSWTVGNSGVADALRAVAFGNNTYVAVGLNGRIVYSTNGTSWTSAENVSGYHYYGISYLNGYFIAVGGAIANGGAAKVKISTNGITWTDVSPSPAIIGHFHSVTYGGGKYLLVGRDNTLGIQKFISTTTTDITSNSGYTTPIGVTTPEGEVGAAGNGAVIYQNAHFIALANLKASPFSAYVLTSTDGTSWTATAANTTGRLRGITTVGSAFKAVGTMDTRLNITAGASMPLRLLNFTANNNNGQVLLRWKTTDEVNTQNFDIERSVDGRSFSTIGTVSAVNKNGENNYSYNDLGNDLPLSYYRLKMVDIDGKFTYSSVVKLSTSAKKPVISLYPNPATDVLNVSLPASTEATLNFFNNKGEKVLTRSVRANSSQVSIRELRSGTYFVHIRQNGNLHVVQVIKK